MFFPGSGVLLKLEQHEWAHKAQFESNTPTPPSSIYIPNPIRSPSPI